MEITVDNRTLLVKEWTVKEMREIRKKMAGAAKDAREGKILELDEDYDQLLENVKANVISGITDYDSEKSRFISKVWQAILQANSGLPLESPKSLKESSSQMEKPVASKVPVS